jgi:hypothetical protein
VTAVETFGQAQDRRQRANGPPALAAELAVAFVAVLWRGLAMIPGNQRNGFDLVWIEAAEIAVPDEVVRMLVMALVADVHADIVQQRGVLQPFTLAIGQAVHRARLFEQGNRQPGHLLRVLRPEVAALGKLEDAAPAHVGVAIGLNDFLTVPRDVVKHQPFAQ